MNTTDRAKRAAVAFFGREPSNCIPYGNGHINDTFLICYDKKYILQRVNDRVFPDPRKISENMLKISEYLKSRQDLNDYDLSKNSICPLPALDGNHYHIDELGGFYRVFEFVEGTMSRDRIESTNDIKVCGRAFGRFQRMLSDFPIDNLSYTIENFHNTSVRYEQLMQAISRDPLKRAGLVKDEIDFAKKRKSFCQMFEEAHKKGILPLKPTHNDTKLNNILFDKESGEAVCIIDLDTVMPGFSVNDFGDLIRFAANTAEEDEKDLSLVSLDIALFEACAEGFIDGCAESLSDEECALLPHSAIMMTLENGMRFLSDYIEGDLYYKTSRPNHNLDRARCQFALVRDMEKRLPMLIEIIERIKKTAH